MYSFCPKKSGKAKQNNDIYFLVLIEQAHRL